MPINIVCQNCGHKHILKEFFIKNPENSKRPGNLTEKQRMSNLHLLRRTVCPRCSWNNYFNKKVA